MARLFLGITIFCIVFGMSLSASVVCAQPQSIPVRNDWPNPVDDWGHSPVDLSFLNKDEIPAGKHGFLHAVGENLVFADGIRARFWGVNITAYALFKTSQQEVIRQASRLSQLGFNMVRLHHFDSPWVNPNIFGDRNEKTTLKLNAPMLEKLDWWIYCLKKEGIYTWLDLHVQRRFKKGDGITALAEIPMRQSNENLKGYSYVNPSMKQAMIRFNKAYLTHVNAYTKVPYKDDPAIAIVMLTNENDITNHFANSLLPDRHVPWHEHQYMQKAKDFAAQHGMGFDQVWRSWEHGPSKLFLNDLEYKFNAEMISHLREIGVKTPIVTTSTWGNNPLSSLPALTAGDVIDVHSYGTTGELERNPLKETNMADWMSAAQVVGKPMAVSEWNVAPFPVKDRYQIPPYIATVASQQGWDIVLQYAYSQQPFNRSRKASNWQSFNDNNLLITFPAAALIFRRGDVNEAKVTYVFAPDQRMLFYKLISPKNAIALRTAAERGKLSIALPEVKSLPWLKKSIIPQGAITLSDPGFSLLKPDAIMSISSNGELRHDWSRGTYAINTPKTQGVIGLNKGEKIELSDITVMARDKKCVVLVQSMDGKPIKTSRDLSITIASQSMLDKSKQAHVIISLSAVEGLSLFDTGLSHQLSAVFSHGRYQLSLLAKNTAFRLKGVQHGR